MPFQQKLRLHKSHNLATSLADHILLDPPIFEAFATTERELFVPQGMRHNAYTLDALPLAGNQWISSPLTVAKMTQALEPLGVDAVLEIGCGSGYQAAILSKIVRRVFTIERIEKLLREAKLRFDTLGIRNIHARFDDGQRGWRDYAPYERILFSASTPKVPALLFDQLKEGGVLIAPIEQGEKQIITRFMKCKGTIREEKVGECWFVPVQDGVIR
ncbi:MAG: protein-L-isoaspartate(D-aspartate) O-methyltransferase [Campylobacterales bacterium]|nr:protein-L-isoaspartate(D-aspartate) O-methyltransferase [Campylobacterales bacterium]